LEDTSKDGKVMIRTYIRKIGGNVWTGFIWIRIGTNGGLI